MREQSVDEHVEVLVAKKEYLKIRHVKGALQYKHLSFNTYHQLLERIS